MKAIFHSVYFIMLLYHDGDQRGLSGRRIPLNLKELKYLSLSIICLCFVFLMAGRVGVAGVVPSANDLRNVDGRCYMTPVKSQYVPGQWWNSVGLRNES